VQPADATRVADSPPRVFVDTNVWISAFINPSGAPAQVLAAFRAGAFVPVVSIALLDEIHAVLSRPRIRRRIRFSDEHLSEILDAIADKSVEALPSGTLQLCRDPADDLLLEAAILGGAQFAVSRDDDVKRDLDLIVGLRAQGIEVLTVAQFLTMLAAR
jgi:uncharacterized protein